MSVQKKKTANDGANSEGKEKTKNTEKAEATRHGGGVVAHAFTHRVREAEVGGPL